MKADLQSLLAPKGRNKLQEFIDQGYDMEGDTDLFLCLNENWKSDAQFPHEVTGEIARIKLSQGYYHIEYSRPNPSPKRRELEKLSAETARKARQAVEEARKQTMAAKAGDADTVAQGDDGVKETKQPEKKPNKKTAVID